MRVLFELWIYHDRASGKQGLEKKLNHDNRSKSVRTNKIVTSLISHLKAQGVEITPDQEIAALNVMAAEKKVERLDGDGVIAAASELGFDVGVSVTGKYSMGMGFKTPFGENRYIDVGCSGEKYWIEVVDGKEKDKWCMPRNEVSGDRADKFLIEVLRTLQETSGLLEAVGICLGIGGQPSIGHTKAILAKRRSSKNA